MYNYWVETGVFRLYYALHFNHSKPVCVLYTYCYEQIIFSNVLNSEKKKEKVNKCIWPLLQNILKLYETIKLTKSLFAK